MKKTLSLSLIIVASLFLSACGVKDNSSSDSSNKSDPKASFSLRELIAKNIPQKCTYSGINQEGNFESEVIVSGDKFNQTVKVTDSNGEEQTIYTISDGEYYYTWGVAQGQTFATKMKADFSSENEDNQDYQADEESFNQEASIDLDNNFQGTCSPTVISNADFQPPTDVDFTDYSQMIEQWQNMDASDFMNLE
jgi:ABC-type Fe3+-hydroxamate transport system substrate-binding protein